MLKRSPTTAQQIDTLLEKLSATPENKDVFRCVIQNIAGMAYANGYRDGSLVRQSGKKSNQVKEY